MAGKREKPEEIVSKLRQVEVLQGQGATITKALRQIGVTQQTTIDGESSMVECKGRSWSVLKSWRRRTNGFGRRCLIGP